MQLTELYVVLLKITVKMDKWSLRHLCASVTDLTARLKLQNSKLIIIISTYCKIIFTILIFAVLDGRLKSITVIM